MVIKKGVYDRIFFQSLRTAIILASGFIIYEILTDLEKKWNKNNPGNKTYYFYKRNILKFIFIFFLDFTLLYIFFFVFNELL
jgi:hypothetical protein